MPEVVQGVDATAWPLSAAGRSAARRLSHALPDGAVLVSSPEVKAVQTLEEASGTRPLVDARFREVCRPGEPLNGEFRERRRAWVESRLDDRHPGWETPDEAAARLQAGVDGYPSQDVVVATHGMVMVAWLVSIGHVPAGDAAGDRWSSLAFPDLVTVTVAGAAPSPTDGDP